MIRSQNDRSVKYKIDNVIKNDPLLLLSGFDANELDISSNCKNISKTILLK